MVLAVGAESLDQIVNTFHLETFWKRDGWNVNGVKAERALTASTVEMNVLVVE